MSKQYQFWDILAWVAFGIVVVYFVLKIVGVLHSPPIADLIAVASAAYFIGRYAKRIDDGFDDVERIKDDVRELDEKCPVFKGKRTRTR